MFLSEQVFVRLIVASYHDGLAASGIDADVDRHDDGEHEDRGRNSHARRETISDDDPYRRHLGEAARGGPRNSDSLLRWDPDPGKGVWHATEETELSC